MVPWKKNPRPWQWWDSQWQKKQYLFVRKTINQGATPKEKQICLIKKIDKQTWEAYF